MTNFLIFLAAAALLAVIAPRYGADTRDSRDWRAVEPFPPEGAAVPVMTGQEAGRVRVGRQVPRRRAGVVRASRPRGTVGIHRF